MSVSAHKPLLGKVLVERGFVSATEIEAALGEQGRRGTRLGDTLVALGCINRRQLRLALAEQRLRWLAAAFGAFVMGLQPVSASAHNLFNFDRTIETGGPVVPPAGFITFCMAHQDACVATANASSAVDATRDRLDQLDTIQEKVNAAIEPRNDPAHVWDYPVNGTGDCNKYALEKRRELIAFGWPEQSLLLAVVMTETNEEHLVLVARTSRGDMVLDNRTPKVVAWNSLPYRWIELQSAEKSMQWVSVVE